MPKRELQSMDGTKMDLSLIEQNETKTDKFDEVDLHIVQRILKTPTVTDQEIATDLGISRQTVNRRRTSSGVKSMIRKQLSLSELEVRRLALKAFQSLERLMDSEDPRIQLAASTAILRLAENLVTPSEPFEFSEW